MLQTQWSMSQIKQCEEQLEQAMLSDEQSLVSFSTDFGHFFKNNPAAVVVPESLQALQKIIRYAYEHNLPVTIRGNGLSQNGQSIAVSGGIIVNTSKLNQILTAEAQSIWVEANCSWSDVIDAALLTQQIPYVVPYNCGLSVAGVISAGGLGASSFKEGSAVAHIDALEVVKADGSIEQIDGSSDLFHACLGGQGRFAVISKVKVQLRPCGKQVKTFYLLYHDRKQWQQDLYRLKDTADYIEAFCTPAIQGAKTTPEGRRMPFAEWFYALHVSWEYDVEEPKLPDDLQPWKIVHHQSESVHSYLHRHDGRFQVMKLSGQWEQQHAWYECFVASSQLFNELETILPTLPLHYATVLQIVMVNPMQQQGFFMLPDTKDCCAVMILNPGLPEALIPPCLATIKALDERFLPKGGKRYLSGYLGNDIDDHYWRQHFGASYEKWIEQKKVHDHKSVFCSLLYE